MRTLKLTSILLLLAMNTQAQTYYYNATKTFTGTGYKYQCDMSGSGRVTLYNKDNRFTYVPRQYRNNAVHDPIERLHWQSESWTEPKIKEIVNNALSAQEKARVKDGHFTIRMYINPDTGKITEVNFSFMSFDPFATIPVAAYRQMETQLKSQVWVIPTAEGKKYNYIFYGWRFNRYR